MSTKRDAAAKRWCLTINNPQAEDEERFSSEKIQYAIVGREIAPDTGTKHLQCYVCLRRQDRFSGLKKLFPRAHIEKAQGTVLQNQLYCKKGEQSHAEWKELKEKGPNYGKNANYFEVGEAPPDEKRKRDYDKALELVKAGKKQEIQADILIPYYSSLSRMEDELLPTPPDLEKLDNEWIYGATGIGKSRSWRARYPSGYYLKSLDEKWNNYRGEKIVVIEDIDIYNRALGGPLKRWADHYAFPADKKYGYLVIRPEKIIVTSNYSIREIWPDAQTYEPLERRFKITHLVALGTKSAVVQVPVRNVQCLQCNFIGDSCTCNK